MYRKQAFFKQNVFQFYSHFWEGFLSAVHYYTFERVKSVIGTRPTHSLPKQQYHAERGLCRAIITGLSLREKPGMDFWNTSVDIKGWCTFNTVSVCLSQQLQQLLRKHEHRELTRQVIRSKSVFIEQSLWINTPFNCIDPHQLASASGTL